MDKTIQKYEEFFPINHYKLENVETGKEWVKHIAHEQCVQAAKEICKKQLDEF